MKHVLLIVCLTTSVSLSALQTSYWTDYTKAYNKYVAQKNQPNADKLWTAYDTLKDQPTQITYAPSLVPGGARRVVDRETVAANWITRADSQMREFESDKFLQRKFYSDYALDEIKDLEKENKNLLTLANDLRQTINDLDGRVKKLEQEKAACEANIKHKHVPTGEQPTPKIIPTTTTPTKK